MGVHFEFFLYYHYVCDFSDCHFFDVKIEKLDSPTKSSEKGNHFSNKNFMVETKWPTMVRFYFEVPDKQLETAHLSSSGVYENSIKKN